MLHRALTCNNMFALQPGYYGRLVALKQISMPKLTFLQHKIRCRDQLSEANTVIGWKQLPGEHLQTS